MIYDNRYIRRRDRLMDDAHAMELLKNGEYGVLSMVTVDNSSYGIPINYVWDGKNAIYFHCAPVGEKILHLSENSKICFTVVGKTQVISSQFSTAYESILVFGSVSMNLLPEERMLALHLILDKYSPDDKEAGIKYTEKTFSCTTVLRIDITRMSGKTKKGR